MPPDGNHIQGYELGHCYDGSVPTAFRIERDHTEGAYVSWYLRNGSVTVESGQHTLHAQAGDWVFMDPMATRSHHFSKDTTLISIRFRLSWHGSLRIPANLVPHTYRGEFTDALKTSAEALCLDEPKRDDAEKQALASDYFFSYSRFANWLYHWHRIRESLSPTQPVHGDPRVFAIMKALNSQSGLLVIDYESLCSTVGLSKAQINRIFKAATGLTPKQWCEAHCLKSAEDYLNDQAHSIKEIAALLGFCDASHFTKWFQQRSGFSPKVWRKHYRHIL